MNQGVFILQREILIDGLGYSYHVRRDSDDIDPQRIFYKVQIKKF